MATSGVEENAMRLLGAFYDLSGEKLTEPVEVALLGAFTFIVGAFALILWDLLRGRRRGRMRVMAVVVGAPACALAATLISAGVEWAVAVTLEPEEPSSPAHRADDTRKPTEDLVRRS